MTPEQVIRIQRELLPGSGSFPDGDPFLIYGMWVFPFTKRGIGLRVFLVDRAISSEADHEQAKEEAAERFREAVVKKDNPRYLPDDRQQHAGQ
jgi:hypothetical protein